LNELHWNLARMSRAQLIASCDSAWLGIPGSRIASWLESTARVEQLDLQMCNKNRLIKTIFARIFTESISFFFFIYAQNLWFWQWKRVENT
jgi:hypothetical protein